MKRILVTAFAAACLLGACDVAPAAYAGTGCGIGGHPGVCAPPSPLVDLGLRAHALSPVTLAPAGIPFEDLSNNNPCVCGITLRVDGFKGLIVKGNQADWIDPTGQAMARSARASGLATGVYDFDATYTIAEAKTLIQAAETDGLTPTGKNEFPLIFDVEYGPFTLKALLAQITYVESQGWRVEIYTGEWWWTPHVGAVWPAGVRAWISGYPVVIPIPGMPAALFVMHQWADVPVDQDVFLGSLAKFLAFVNDSPPKPKPKPVVKPKPKPVKPGKKDKTVCFGKGSAPNTTKCRPIVAHHWWLVERRDDWHVEYIRHDCVALNRKQTRRNVRDCGRSLHWWTTRRGQAVRFKERYS